MRPERCSICVGERRAHPRAWFVQESHDLALAVTSSILPALTCRRCGRDRRSRRRVACRRPGGSRIAAPRPRV
eukprot:13592343-Heterocapsa_arctica.AAC.1